MSKFRVYVFLSIALVLLFTSPVVTTPVGMPLSETTPWTSKTLLALMSQDSSGMFSASDPSPSPEVNLFNFIVSYWKNLSDDEGNQQPQPTPSPSESPVPQGIGDSPLQVDYQTSSHGLNEASYSHFVLNDLFYHEQHEEPSSQVYQLSKSKLHNLMRLAEEGSLSELNRILWQEVANAIINSFKEEHGAVFFDVAFSRRWKYCGWVNMSETAVNTDKTMRLCASLTSLGMKHITRPPEDGKDFILPGMSDLAQIQELLYPVVSSSSGLQTWDYSASWDGSGIWNSSGTSSGSDNDDDDDENTSDREFLRKGIRYYYGYEYEYEYVDLLAYPSYCESPLYVDPECYSFCCLSPYYGSSFCNGCMYF